MVSSKYFFEVCEARCWKRTPVAEVISTNFPGIVAFEPADAAGLVALCCACNHQAQPNAQTTASRRVVAIASVLMLEKRGRENFTQIDR